MIVGQGPTVLAVDAGADYLNISFLSLQFIFSFSLSLLSSFFVFMQGGSMEICGNFFTFITDMWASNDSTSLTQTLAHFPNLI